MTDTAQFPPITARFWGMVENEIFTWTNTFFKWPKGQSAPSGCIKPRAGFCTSWLEEQSLPGIPKPEWRDAVCWKCPEPGANKCAAHTFSVLPNTCQGKKESKELINGSWCSQICQGLLGFFWRKMWCVSEHQWCQTTTDWCLISLLRDV